MRTRDTDSETTRRDGCRVGPPADDWRTPRTLEQFLPSLDIYASHRDSQGLVTQEGLRTAPLPLVQIDTDTGQVDTGDDVARYQEFLQEALGDASLFSPQPSPDNHFSVSLETSDLEPGLDANLQGHLSEIERVMSGDLSRQWLPLCRTEDRDQGLEFPPEFEKTRALLLRELEREQITLSEGAIRFYEEVCDVEWTKDGGEVSRLVSPGSCHLLTKKQNPGGLRDEVPLSVYELPFLHDDEVTANSDTTHTGLRKGADGRTSRDNENTVVQAPLAVLPGTTARAESSEAVNPIAETATPVPDMAEPTRQGPDPHPTGRLLASAGDNNATANLLARFMEMRAPRKPQVQRRTAGEKTASREIPS